MSRFVHLDAPDDTIGIEALRRLHAEGPARHRLGVVIEIEGHLAPYDRKGRVTRDGQRMGHLTATTWSPRLGQNIGIVLVSRDLAPGDSVTLHLPDGRDAQGTLCGLPFL